MKTKVVLLLALLLPIGLWANDHFFAKNEGQLSTTAGAAATAVHYYLTTDEADVFVTPTGLHYQFYELATAEGGAPALQGHSLGVLPVGSQPSCRIRSRQRAAYVVHDYDPAAPSGYRRIDHFHEVAYEGLYPNIDWVIRTQARGLKYDFVVQPGGQPSAIRLDIRGASGLRLTTDGGLELLTPLGSVRERQPYAYQETADGRKQIACRFKLEGEQVVFEVGNYDATLPLIIDPYLTWGTYYGSDYAIEQFEEAV